MKGILLVTLLSCLLMACATFNSGEQGNAVSAEQSSIEKSIIQSNSESSPEIAMDDPTANEATQVNQEAAVSHEVTEAAPTVLPEMVETPAPENIATTLPEKKSIFPENSYNGRRSEVARYSKTKAKKSVQKSAKKSSSKRMIASKAKKAKVAKKMSKAQCKKIAKNIKKAKKSEVAMCKIAKKRYAKL